MKASQEHTSDIAGALVDHYTRFLGAPAARQVYRAEGLGTSLQVLCFRNVFPGCVTYATIGFGRFTAAYSPEYIEVLLVADHAAVAAERFLAQTLFAVASQQIPLAAGVSVGGVGPLGEEFELTTGKSAFYFTEPTSLPDEFCDVRPHVSVLMAIPVWPAEHQFIGANGGDAFESILERHEVDPFDVRRPPVC